MLADTVLRNELGSRTSDIIERPSVLCCSRAYEVMSGRSWSGKVVCRAWAPRWERRDRSPSALSCSDFFMEGSGRPAELRCVFGPSALFNEERPERHFELLVDMIRLGI